MEHHPPQAANVHTTTLDGGILLVRVEGAVDAACHKSVASELTDLINGRSTAVLLDLREVTFLASIGIAILINAHHRARRLDIGFAIVAANRNVLRPLKAAQVDNVLPVFPTLDEALRAVRLTTS